MDERMPPAAYFQYPPSRVQSSPHHSISPNSDRERYAAELLAERQKLTPFIQVLPFWLKRHLNQEFLQIGNPQLGQRRGRSGTLADLNGKCRPCKQKPPLCQHILHCCIGPVD